MDTQDYIFTKDWFDQNSRQNWDKIIPIINPKKILEIVSYFLKEFIYTNTHKINRIETLKKLQNID